eukprot:15469094-Alexandrium_andersonii.AAC.1
MVDGDIWALVHAIVAVRGVASVCVTKLKAHIDEGQASAYGMSTGSLRGNQAADAMAFQGAHSICP